MIFSPESVLLHRQKDGHEFVLTAGVTLGQNYTRPFRFAVDTPGQQSHRANAHLLAVTGSLTMMMNAFLFLQYRFAWQHVFNFAWGPQLRAKEMKGKWQMSKSAVEKSIRAALAH